MFWNPFGNLFGLILPFIFILVGVRMLRHFLGAGRRTHDDHRMPPLPYDDLTTTTHYPARADLPDGESIETVIFRLADEMKGRLTVSDIVIGTNLGLKEAERVIDRLVDGAHVTMEVNESGRVIYEFPEIIARYEQDEEGGTIGSSPRR